MIYRLFGLGKVTLTIDRTNWKWGKSNLNIFMLGVVYKGIAIPLYWQMLDKRGNTNHLERCELIERFIKQFGKDNLEMIVADREFVGENGLTGSPIITYPLPYGLRRTVKLRIIMASWYRLKSYYAMLAIKKHIDMGEY